MLNGILSQAISSKTYSIVAIVLELLSKVAWQLATSAAVAGFIFLFSLVFRKQIKEKIRYLIHKHYGVEIDHIFESRSSSDEDLIKDLDKSNSLSIWTSRGIDLSSSEKFQKILERSSKGNFSVKVLLPNPVPPNDEYDWTAHRNLECKRFDEGMSEGVLNEQILATISYLQTPIARKLLSLKLVNTLQLGRLVITDSNAYFSPYTPHYHGTSSRVLKCPASGMLYNFFKRIFDALWESGQDCNSSDVTTKVSIVGIQGVRSVIFDLDGSIVDSMNCHGETTQEVFLEQKEKEVCISLKTFASDFGGLSSFDLIKAVAEQHKLTMTNEAIANLAKRKDELFLQRLDTLEGFPAVVELIRSLKGKLPLALVSSSSKQIVFRLLQHLRLEDHFEIIISSDDGYPSKPDPRGFLVAAAKLKLVPNECLVVEDSTAGFAAAAAADMRCIDVNCLVNLVCPNNSDHVQRLIAARP